MPVFRVQPTARMHSFCRGLCGQLCLSLAISCPAGAQQQRPMLVDDLLAIQRFGSIAASPDGQWLAVVISRANTKAETYRDVPFDGGHADIWLVPSRGGESRNLTNGAADGSGFWNPVWSPDGKRLALLSTKGGGNIRPYVYELDSGLLVRLTERGADLEAKGDEGFGTYPMIWSDGRTVLCPVRAEGALPSYYGMSKVRSLGQAVQRWTAAERGTESTASVLESGRELAESRRPKGALLAIDVVTTRSYMVAEGNVRQLLLSPTRQHLAVFIETGRIPPHPAHRMPWELDNRYFDLWRTRLAVVRLENRVNATWVNRVPDPRLTFFDVPHAWSPDGRDLAVVAKDTKDDVTAGILWLVSARGGTPRRVTGREIQVRAATWSTAGDLLALARVHLMAKPDCDQPRLDWWRIGQGVGRVRNLTEQLKSVPEALVRTTTGSTMLGISSGDLWSIHARDGRARNTTGAFKPEVEAVEWPSVNRQRAGPVEQLIVRTKGDGLYTISPAGTAAQAKELSRPSASSRIAEFRPEQQLVAFTDYHPTGTFLWTGDGQASRFEQRIALNPQLAHIADTRKLLIEYRATEGDSQKALLLLPFGYEAGKRYPLITYVYAGDVQTDTSSYPLIEKTFSSAFNLNLLASHGYAVLVPSIPLESPATGSDAHIEAPKGVIAAVDRAIDLGIADPERLGVMGHSYGGYTTYSLITYTQRFKAAVSQAGLSNLVSLYGTFYTPLRYDEYAHEASFWPALAESGQLRMGNKPWDDLWRYLRNSPLYYVDRVQTPVMIVHGDIDYAPIQQSEEFFMALYRMGKEAKFVRYWGEGHVISSPANIRDMWRRIFGWFDEHLKGDKPTATPAGRP